MLLLSNLLVRESPFTEVDRTTGDTHTLLEGPARCATPGARQGGGCDSRQTDSGDPPASNVSDMQVTRSIAASGCRVSSHRHSCVLGLVLASRDTGTNRERERAIIPRAVECTSYCTTL